MASKTQSGQQFSARSMNGIIELDDGAGTLISGGVIQTNNINTGNLTSDFITANNLLEADVDETITGKWTFSQTPYITEAPTDANDAVNKSYIDNNFVDLTTNQSVAGNKVFTGLNTFQNITFMTDARMDAYYSPTLSNQVVDKQYVDDNFVGLLGTQNIIGTKTFENAFMSASYTPVSAKQITTKEYVDAIGNPTIESVLQQGNDANGETMTGLSNLTMNTGYTPTLDLEVSTKNYSDAFTGKIDATNNSFFTQVEFFNAPFQRSGTTTIPVGTYTIQSLLTQIATSLQQTFIADVPPSVVLTEWTFDPATNKVSAKLPNNTIIPELTHRIDPLLQLLGFQGARPNNPDLYLGRTSPPTPADHPQHLPYVKQYVDDNFLNIANNPILTNIRDNSLVGGTQQLYYNTTTGEIGKVLSVSPIIDLEYVLLEGNSANGNTMTDVGSINMAVGYVPSSSRQVATKSYVDGLVSGGGITEGLLFDSNGNSRFQKPSASPTNFYGSNNTMIGFESAKMLPNDILTLRNTFLGYRSGYYFAQGYVGSTDNTFLGAYAGWDGTTTPYSYNRTTCVGYRSYGDKSDQIALGDGNGEIRARGSLLVDGGATFNGSGTGLVVNTISSFTQDAYRKIGSISYKFIDELSILAYQTIANLATSYISNDTTYFSTKYIYDNFYPTANCFATFFQKASIQFNYDPIPANDECYSTSYLNTTLAGMSSTTIKRTPKYFTEWRYNTNNTTNTGTLTSWSNGAIAFSDFSPLPANTGQSTFTLGENAVAGTEYLGQRNQYGTWVATVAGMYKIELVLQPYPSWTMRLWVEYLRGGASWEIDSYLRSNGTVSTAGTSPYGQVCNYSSIQYLDVGHGIRVRSSAEGSSSYGYIYTHYKSSYLKITRISGYT